jgi:hypothetical protein
MNINTEIAATEQTLKEILTELKLLNTAINTGNNKLDKVLILLSPEITGIEVTPGTPTTRPKI